MKEKKHALNIEACQNPDLNTNKKNQWLNESHKDDKYLIEIKQKIES